MFGPVNYIESTIGRWKQPVGEMTLQSRLPPWEANVFIYLSIYHLRRNST